MATCELEKISLSKEKLGALSTDQRFAFFFLGHAFNEIMTLQKLSLAVRPSSPVRSPIGEGSTATTALVLRLLAGKILEASERMNDAPVGPILVRDYVDLVLDLKERVRVINQRITRSKWYHALRR